MNKKFVSLVRAAVGVLAMAAAGSATAQSTFVLNLSSNNTTQSCAQQVAGCTNNSVNGKFSAWSTSADSPTSLLVGATITDQDGSGIGVNSGGESSGSPQHAIDSSGKDELILINFGTSVALTGVSTGWSYNDTDISLLRWDGNGAPNLAAMSLTGAAGLLNSGWTLVASQDLDGQATSGATYSSQFSTSGFNSTTSSSWWIVSAYFGSSAGNLDKDNDYFKLLKVSGCVGSYTTTNGCQPGGSNNSAPTPGSLALAGLALAGLTWRRRTAR